MASSSSFQPRCFQGPLNDTVFCLQAKHISAQVFKSKRPSNVVALARRADGTVWSEWSNEMEICEGTANYVAQMGFGTFFKLGNMRNDHSLLHALLERFRPETHTFQLPVGEVMISLEDVEVLLGLRVDGYHVGSNPTGLVVPDTAWKAYVHEMLGIEELPHGRSIFEADWLVTSHLQARIRRPATFTEADMQQRARCFVLWMLGNGLFINAKKQHVHKDMILCVADFNVCSGYSWGSAVLAYLDDLNWDQIQNAFGEFGGVGGTGDGGSAAGLFNSSWGGYDHSMPAQPPSGGGYDGLVTGTTYPSGGGYEGGMIGTTYLSGGGYDGGMSSTTYLSGGGYVGGMSSTTYPSGAGYDGDDLDLNLSLRPSEQSAVVDGSQGVYRTPEQERRRLTRPVGRRDSNLHVRPTQGIGFGTRPRRIFSPEATDEDD